MKSKFWALIQIAASVSMLASIYRLWVEPSTMVFLNASLGLLISAVLFFLFGLREWFDEKD